MKLKALVIGIASALALSSNSWAVEEIEENHPIQSANILVPADVVTIDGKLGGLNGKVLGESREDDLDFYQFYGNAGDVVTLDIDGGIGGAMDVNTVIAVFDDQFMMKRMNYYNTVDEGSTSIADARIDNFTLEKSGYYYVGVSNYPRFFRNGGGVWNTQLIANGDYKLVVTGLKPDVMQINIDVKPGNDDDNEWAPINPKSRGKIPVALLSSGDFDAMSVDVSSLRFGAGGGEESLSHCNKSGKDVNGDGMLDMLCHFYNQKAGFDNESVEGVVSGRTVSGTAFEGHGILKVVPGKK